MSSTVAVSPANPEIILVGGATGGIWRSSDGGANFFPVSDDQVDTIVRWIEKNRIALPLSVRSGTLVFPCVSRWGGPPDLCSISAAGQASR